MQTGRRATMPELLRRHLALNAQTWGALVRLGVRDGDELALAFAYATAGPEADRELAGFLERETAYAIELEPGGVTGRTVPMPVSAAALDDWVRSMMRAGQDHGGCAFDGWTTTVQAAAPRRAPVRSPHAHVSSRIAPFDVSGRTAPPLLPIDRIRDRDRGR